MQAVTLALLPFSVFHIQKVCVWIVSSMSISFSALNNCYNWVVLELDKGCIK